MKLISSPSDHAPVLRLDRFLPYRLSVLANRVSRALERLYAERHDLSVPQWRVLAVLAETPDLAANQVAERTAMDKVMVSRAVSGLLRARRLLRKVDPADRRRATLRLSERGWRVYRVIVPAALDLEAVLTAELTARERDALDRLLSGMTTRALTLYSEAAS